MSYKELLKDNELKEKSLKSGPAIVYDSLELQVAIGQWLKLLPLEQTIDGSVRLVSTLEEAYDLIEKYNIKPVIFDAISTEFSKMLQIFNIDNNEVCILSNMRELRIFNKYELDENVTFNCHLSSLNNDVLIGLGYDRIGRRLIDINNPIKKENLKKQSLRDNIHAIPSYKQLKKTL